jgi:16S rRNA (guanine966-N2)-methyltransferase
VTLVDKATGAVMRANTARVSRSMGAPADVAVIAQPVHAFLLGARGAFDVVFVDPPYELAAAELERELGELAGLLTTDAVVIVERSARDPEPAWPAPLVLDRRKDYGDTALYWLALEPQPDPPAQSA